jgi:CRP-like cAMP-binding protein
MGENRVITPPVVPCARCPLRPKPVFRPFSDTELTFVQKFKAGETHAKAGDTLLMQGAGSEHLYTVLSGWAMRHKTLPDGRRQILNFALPGDLIGIQSSVEKEMQHSVEALTDVVLCVFPRGKLWDLYQNHPGLAFDVTWLASREEHLISEQLVSVGRRTAQERVAFMLLHLYMRAEQVDLARNDKASFPFTQQHIADTLGMSLVHANKTIRRLVAANVIRWKDRVFEIRDREKLAEIAMYDLDERRPRPLI